MNVSVFRSVALFFSVLGVVGSGHASRTLHLSLTLEPLHVPTDFKILSLRMSVLPGHLTSVSGVPAGWVMVIDNDPEDKLSVKGGGSLAASAVTLQELENIRFLVDEYSPGAIPVCGGELDATHDFEHNMTLKVVCKEE